MTFKAGLAPAGARTTSVNLDNGWHVQVSESVNTGAIFANANSLALLSGGILISLLLGLPIVVLATGRRRALTLLPDFPIGR